MTRFHRTKRILLAASALAFAASPAIADAAASRMADAANTWLASLSQEQRRSATYTFDSPERTGWHYIPKNRNGLSLRSMAPEQVSLAYALLASSMSQDGFVTSTTVMSLEKVLQQLEGPGRRFPRDPALYHVTIFGTPSDEGTWGWRYEGHHLSLNFTIVDGDVVSATPAFFGSNPAEILSGTRKGLRALAAEEDMGFELARTLTAKQRKVAVFDAVAPKEIFTSADRSVKPLDVKGLSYADMTKEQREILVELVKVYLNKHNPDVAAYALHEISRHGWSKVVFAWAGPISRDTGNYYMAQGPTFLLEYDNTQNNNNHVHAVWRDFDGDFGDDLLKTHHAEAH